MKHFKRLDTRGFAHHFLLVIVVLAVAITGTAYLVASHADNSTALTSSQISANYTKCMASAKRTPGIQGINAQRKCASDQQTALAQLQAQQKAETTVVKSTTPATTTGSTATSTKTSTSSGGPKTCNLWGITTYVSGSLDATNQSVNITCAAPTTNDPCGGSGGKLIPCTPVNPHPSATTCNYGGIYPNCIRFIGNVEFYCPNNYNGTTACDTSTAEPVSSNTTIPTGCYWDLQDGQQFVICPEGTVVNSAAPTDWDITQEYNSCVAGATTAGEEAGCTYTNTYQECLLHAASSAAKNACKNTFVNNIRSVLAPQGSSGSNSKTQSSTGSKTESSTSSGTSSSSSTSSSTSGSSTSKPSNNGNGKASTSGKSSGSTKKKSTGKKVVDTIKKVVEFWKW